jgi:hypothetical protein
MSGFKFRVTESKFTLLDDRQWYPARLLDIVPDELEWKGQPVPKFKFIFAILDPPEFEGRKVNGMVNQPSGTELNERHHLFQWITALRGGQPPSVGDDIDFPGEFIGKTCLLKTKSTKKNYDGKEMTFQNIDKLAVCQNPDEYASKAPDAVPVTQQEAPSTPPPTPDAPTTPAPEAPAPAPETPAPAPSPEPAPPQPEPTGAAGEGSSTVEVDGEEFDCPF